MMKPGELKKQIENIQKAMRLREAAPDMYEALKEVTATFEAEALPDSVFEAINKAEGK